MRGDDEQQASVWSYVPLEQRVPTDHPLRAMRAMVDEVLTELSPQFSRLYAKVGRPSIAPERLLRALLLQVLYSVRSERLLMEQLDYNLLFRWFVGLSADDPIWDATVFTKNRQRLLEGDIARAFFDRIVAQARQRAWLSDEHFTVDGTLIEAWASLKSFKSKDAPPVRPDDPGNPTVNFHGERRSNATHASTTDPDARLFRKGDAHEAKLYYQGHVLMENRHGLAVDGSLTPATGFAEREQALAMAARLPTTSPKTSRNARVRSIAAPRATQATRRANADASGSKRSSAGSRWWACCARPAIAGSPASAGCLPLGWPSTTWSGCGGSWRSRHEPPRSPSTARGSGARSGARAALTADPHADHEALFT